MLLAAGIFRDVQLLEINNRRWFIVYFSIHLKGVGGGQDSVLASPLYWLALSLCT